jgi:translation initiation factor 3 subunit H
MVDLEAVAAAALKTLKLEGLDPELLTSVPLEKVELDALVLLQILQHSAVSPSVTGQLLGVDISGSLQATHSFPFVSPSTSASEEVEWTEEQTLEYQREMLHALRKLNCDANTVGWYQTTLLGSFYNQALIETQANYQSAFPQSIVLIYDPSRTVAGGLCLLALRLSDKFLALYEKEKKITMESVASQKLKASEIFESLPITIRRSFLLEPMLKDWQSDSETVSSYTSAMASPKASYLSSNLDIPLVPVDSSLFSLDDYIGRHVEYLQDCVDEYGQEQWRWQGWHRSLCKEHQKLHSTVSKKRHENSTRIQQGLEPLYTEEELSTVSSPALTKILAQEPSRLETLLILNQMETYCDQLELCIGSIPPPSSTSGPATISNQE